MAAAARGSRSFSSSRRPARRLARPPPRRLAEEPRRRGLFPEGRNLPARVRATAIFLPLWTPLAENGHGSPFPFFYHRLFNSLAGAVALATGSTAGREARDPAAPLRGRARHAQAAPRHGARLRSTRSCGAVLLVFSNYAYTDWVVRGAFGEFAGLHAPAVAHARRARRRAGKRGAGWALGGLLALLFFAHSTSSSSRSSSSSSRSPERSSLERTRAGTLLRLRPGGRRRPAGDGPVRPRGLALRKGPRPRPPRARGCSASSGTSRRSRLPLRRRGRLDLEHLRLHGGDRTRLQHASVLVALAAVLTGLARRTLPLARARQNLPAWGLAVGMGLAFLVLQTPLAAPLYRLVPPVQFLQFPWRLLAFSTVASHPRPVSLARPARVGGVPGRAPVPPGGDGPRRPLPGLLRRRPPAAGRVLLRARARRRASRRKRLAETSVFSGAFRPRGVRLPPPGPFLEPSGCAVEEAFPGEALTGLPDVPEIRLAVEARPGGNPRDRPVREPVRARERGRGGSPRNDGAGRDPRPAAAGAAARSCSAAWASSRPSRTGSPRAAPDASVEAAGGERDHHEPEAARVQEERDARGDPETADAGVAALLLEREVLRDDVEELREPDPDGAAHDRERDLEEVQEEKPAGPRSRRCPSGRHPSEAAAAGGGGGGGDVRGRLREGRRGDVAHVGLTSGRNAASTPARRVSRRAAAPSR